MNAPKLHMNVTNEQLRVDITELRGDINGIREAIEGLKETLKNAGQDRRSGDDKIGKLEIVAANNSGAVSMGKWLAGGFGAALLAMILLGINWASKVNDQATTIAQEKEQISGLNQRLTTAEATVAAVVRDQVITKARDK